MKRSTQIRSETRPSRRYRGDTYWEKETPLKVSTDKLRVCYYPIAGKLQILASWKNRDTRKVRFGRTVVLDALSLAPPVPKRQAYLKLSLTPRA